VYRLFLTALLVIGALSGFVQGGTHAFLTTTAGSTGNTFTAGNVKIGTDVATLSIPVPAMVPGDKFIAPVQVQNNGDLDLRYAMTSTITYESWPLTQPYNKPPAPTPLPGPTPTFKLADDNFFKVTIRTLGSACASEDGTILYGPSKLRTVAFGNPARGSDAGDRTLTAGSNETLCFKFDLQSGASTLLQEQSAWVNFSFMAEQTP